MNKEKFTRAGLEPATSGFFFVHPNLSKICTQSVSLVVYYMMFKKMQFVFKSWRVVIYNCQHYASVQRVIITRVPPYC